MPFHKLPPRCWKTGCLLACDSERVHVSLLERVISYTMGPPKWYKRKLLIPP